MVVDERSNNESSWSDHPHQMLMLWGNNDDNQCGLPRCMSPVARKRPFSELGSPSDPPNLARRRTASVDSAAGEAPLPTPCWGLGGVSIMQVSCGSRHTLALSTSGVAYSWGWGSMGQLGHGDDRTLAEPAVIQAFQDEPVSAVSAGGFHSAAILGGGQVLTWGGSSYGQLGLGPEVMSHAGPQLLPQGVHEPLEGDLQHGAGPLSPMRSTSLGGFGGAVLGPGLSSGKPPPTGGGVKRRRNSVMEADMKRALVAAQEGSRPLGPPLLAAAVSCGGMHTAIVTPKGEVYCWGRADSGQLGIGVEWLHTTDPHCMGLAWPQRVRGPLQGKRVTAVSCGAFHTGVVTAEGLLYTWGKEDYGMLGCSNDGLRSGGLTSPHLITLEDPAPAGATNGAPAVSRPILVKAVACGGWHTIALTTEGEVWTCGRGEYGRLGTGDQCSHRVLQRVQGWGQEKAAQLAAGGSHSLVATESGRLFAFGRAGHGRLGVGGAAGESDRVLEPVEVDLGAAPVTSEGKRCVIHIACGGSHSAAVISAQLPQGSM